MMISFADLFLFAPKHHFEISDKHQPCQYADSRKRRLT